MNKLTRFLFPSLFKKIKDIDDAVNARIDASRTEEKLLDRRVDFQNEKINKLSKEIDVLKEKLIFMHHHSEPFPQPKERRKTTPTKSAMNRSKDLNAKRAAKK